MTSTCDSYYSIGRSHMVCQDVADAWVDETGRGHAVVSDGCTGSPKTEFGAALLVQATRCAPGASCVIFKAAEMAKVCGVPLSCLDATVMSIHERVDNLEHRARAEAWGDGVVLAKFRGKDEWLVCSIEFVKGAPTYQSYLLDDDRLTAYMNETDNGLQTLRWWYRVQGVWKQQQPVSRQGFGPFSQNYFARDFELVIVCSDGVGSFQRKVDGAFEPVPLVLVLDRVIDFKQSNYQGAFVKRRMRRFLMHEAPALGWHHDDDVSVAAIYMGD